MEHSVDMDLTTKWSFPQTAVSRQGAHIFYVTWTGISSCAVIGAIGGIGRLNSYFEPEKIASTLY